uniref:Uncharacterized protein n=1 Tax=Timema monikensis TaxID=170555 RepID=A0A7R9E6C9_9NEOP|nr:unnamed protein product [Timema monikensis]
MAADFTNRSKSLEYGRFNNSKTNRELFSVSDQDKHSPFLQKTPVVGSPPRVGPTVHSHSNQSDVLRLRKGSQVPSPALSVGLEQGQTQPQRGQMSYLNKEVAALA